MHSPSQHSSHPSPHRTDTCQTPPPPVPNPLSALAGSLIKGPNDRTFVLSARHCMALEGDTFPYPWSTYGLLFDFRLPCNSTYVGNISSTFDHYLQGLSLVFEDAGSDVAVFELLQDIPPEWGAVLAGWTAEPNDGSFPFVDVSQPLGDTQKVTTGESYGMYYGAQLLPSDEFVLDNTANCSATQCGFYITVLFTGGLSEGSSGSPLVNAGPGPGKGGGECVGKLDKGCARGGGNARGTTPRLCRANTSPGRGGPWLHGCGHQRRPRRVARLSRKGEESGPCRTHVAHTSTRRTAAQCGRQAPFCACASPVCGTSNAGGRGRARVPCTFQQSANPPPAPSQRAAASWACCRTAQAQPAPRPTTRTASTRRPSALELWPRCVGGWVGGCVSGGGKEGGEGGPGRGRGPDGLRARADDAVHYGRPPCWTIAWRSPAWRPRVPGPTSQAPQWHPYL